MQDETVKLEFVYPSAGTQVKQVALSYAIALAPIALFIGGTIAWEKLQEKRAKKKADLKIVPAS